MGGWKCVKLERELESERVVVVVVVWESLQSHTLLCKVNMWPVSVSKNNGNNNKYLKG